VEKEKTDMVIDYRNRIVNQDLLSFLKDIGCSGIQFRLLCFWGRHPRSKLSLYTVASALNIARINLRDAMTNLVERGILIDQHDDNGLTTYALSGDQRIQECIDELAKLDCSEVINLRKQLKEENMLATIEDGSVPF
jgi:predicted DNA-binding transcriptional regulator